MDFEARIHTVSQHLIPQLANSGYPPMVVYYYRHAPVLLKNEESPLFPLHSDPCLFEALKMLGACADFLVIPFNCPHLFQGAIEEASGLKVISMIGTTLKEVNRQGLKKVGVLGVGEPTIYLTPLGQQGIACEYISQELRAQLDQAILKLQAGQEGLMDKVIARAAVHALRSKEVDGILLGCIEIPLLLQGEANAPDLLNPAQLLAEAAVRYALE